MARMMRHRGNSSSWPWATEGPPDCQGEAVAR